MAEFITLLVYATGSQICPLCMRIHTHVFHISDSASLLCFVIVIWFFSSVSQFFFLFSFVQIWLSCHAHQKLKLQCTTFNIHWRVSSLKFRCINKSLSHKSVVQHCMVKYLNTTEKYCFRYTLIIVCVVFLLLLWAR